LSAELAAIDSEPPSRMTGDERELLRWLADGKRAEEIAELMHLSVASVKQHIYRLKNKTGASTTASMVANALRKGLIK
jgi:DNA-binding CsgD family transcriptional regulator